MSRGIQRERAVRLYLEDRDYVVVRAAGSLGCADLVALRAGSPTLIVEVKSTHRGPFHSFGPADRADILAYAERAGATAVLAYWPPRGKLEFIYEGDWPEAPRCRECSQEGARCFLVNGHAGPHEAEDAFARYKWPEDRRLAVVA